ncbi:hypothetical protein BDP27DRAFT_1440262 [Rhodocollybia butyracea]|uniref:Uncharacterized protein n=1 Tax=Rhodocollybia butyracea TaxID=206335 RepID=A0A9P5TVL6_9AGAR|nr:hypothetical protein BDP27DRAFT_1440262 [Rhodocollybia butyracea]
MPTHLRDGKVDGFSAGTGWDATSGLGTPNLDALGPVRQHESGFCSILPNARF